MNKLFLTALTAHLVVGMSAIADEPKLPKTPAPSIAMATASESDGKISIRLKAIELVPVIEKKTVTEFRTITQNVGGNVVTKQVPIQVAVECTVMKPVWREMKLTVGDAGVAVRDLAGKEVPAKKLATLLEKETAIFHSTTGPVDAFYLQLAKEGTLVVITTPTAPVAGVGVPVPAPVAVPGVVVPGTAVAPPPPPPPPPIPKPAPIKN